VFKCNRCPASFPDFKGLVRHYETHHNQGGEWFKYKTDAKNYASSDSGCQQATDYLGHQSSCLKCPFYKCILDEPGVGIAKAKKRTRKEEIIRRLKAGESIADLAIAFDVSIRTVQRVKRSSEDG